MKRLGRAPDYAKSAFWSDNPRSWHSVSPGVRRRILAHSLTGMLVLYKFEPGKAVPMHRHAQAQFGIVLEGSGAFRIGGSTRHVKQGDSYYIAPGVRHSLKVGTEGPSTIVDFFTPYREDFVAEARPSDG